MNGLYLQEIEELKKTLLTSPVKGMIFLILTISLLLTTKNNYLTPEAVGLLIKI